MLSAYYMIHHFLDFHATLREVVMFHSLSCSSIVTPAICYSLSCLSQIHVSRNLSNNRTVYTVMVIFTCWFNSRHLQQHTDVPPSRRIPRVRSRDRTGWSRRSQCSLEGYTAALQSFAVISIPLWLLPAIYSFRTCQG
jgi:hypothetical protein